MLLVPAVTSLLLYVYCYFNCDHVLKYNAFIICSLESQEPDVTTILTNVDNSLAAESLNQCDVKAEGLKIQTFIFVL